MVTKGLEKANIGGNLKGYFGVVATLVLLIVLVLLVYPAIGHITRLNKELSDARVVKEQLETKLQNLSLAKSSLEEIQEDLPTLELALPIGSDMIPYLKKIESLVKKNRLQIAVVQFSDVPLSKPTVNPSLKTKNMGYVITLQGSFTDFSKFLSDLENFIRTSDVLGLDVAKEEDELKQTLSITTYYLGEDFASSQGAGQPATGQEGL